MGYVILPSEMVPTDPGQEVFYTGDDKDTLAVPGIVVIASEDVASWLYDGIDDYEEEMRVVMAPLNSGLVVPQIVAVRHLRAVKKI